MPALAACSRDEVKEIGNEQLIDFRIAVDTRATETTTDNIGSFFVTAIDENGAVYFKDVEYSDTDKDGSFTSSSPVYWPAGGSLKFYAYAPGAAKLSGTVAISNESQTLTGYTVPADLNNHADFITAYAEGSKAENTAGVGLTFEHRFSQIEVRARNSNQGYVYKVAGVKFGKVASAGSFGFGESEWTDVGTKANFLSEYGAAVSLDGTAQSIMGATVHHYFKGAWLEKMGQINDSIILPVFRIFLNRSEFDRKPPVLWERTYVHATRQGAYA